MTTANHSAHIAALKKSLGDDLAIMAHHYQTDDVIQHADLRGDSLELARKVPEHKGRHIVFCGVFFMAESAALLAGEGQRAYIPDVNARCVMSQMAPSRLVSAVYDRVAASGRKIVPLTYVNSSAAVKAVVGRHGGAVCTSANARIMMRWALDRGDAVLFLPDKNLAMNTANDLGLPEIERRVLDIRSGGARIDASATDKARLLIYPGCCAIHARFNLSQVRRHRDERPDVKIIVHPECPPDVVRASDANGSTSSIIKYVAEADEGATVVVGTEINLVERLAKQYAGTKTILPLALSGCSNMAKITESNLAGLLANIGTNTAVPVTVDQDTTEHARVALERMLEACA